MPKNKIGAGELASIVPPDSQPSRLRTSWPLFNLPIARALLPQRIHSPMRQTTAGRETVPGRTTDTPAPRQKGFLANLFSKEDPRNKTSTDGPQYTTPFDEGKGRPNIQRQRRCCGLSFRTFIILLIALMIIAFIATITPLLVIRGRKPTPGGVSASDCQISNPCHNGGASFLVNNPPQCACLCAGGFSGSQCQTLDSSCIAVSSGGVNNRSIGSAIESLIQVAQADFSNQFNLSSQRIIQQFAASNVSCTSQNSLVNLNGSNSADEAAAPIAQRDVVIFEAWTTTTSTTTITLTFTNTVPFVTHSESRIYTSFSTTSGTSTITSRIPSSTYSVGTTTITPIPSPTTISSQGLVFGRCVILAVVQDFGVSTAAAIQRLLESAIVHGTTLIQDSKSGLVIDLSGETVSGLPKDG